MARSVEAPRRGYSNWSLRGPKPHQRLRQPHYMGRVSLPKRLVKNLRPALAGENRAVEDGVPSRPLRWNARRARFSFVDGVFNSSLEEPRNYRLTTGHGDWRIIAEAWVRNRPNVPTLDPRPITSKSAFRF